MHHNVIKSIRKPNNPIQQLQTMKQTHTDNNHQQVLKNILSAIPAWYRNRLIPSVEALLQSEWSRKVSDPQMRNAMLEQAEDWLHHHKGNNEVYIRLSEVISMLRKLMGSTDLLNKRNIIILAAVVLYTISPIDAVPDNIPVIGWLDDLWLIMKVLHHIGRKTITA